MKKGLKITGIILAALILTVLAAAIIIPVAFRDKIKEKIEAELNDRMNARISFGDYRLSLLKAFPNASFSLDDLSEIGRAHV